MDGDAFDKIIKRYLPVGKSLLKYLVIGFGVVVLLFIFLSFFRMGFVFWFYEEIFNWVSVRLGLDYYLALFISLSVTTLFSASFPYLAWTFLLGRKQYISSLIIIGITGLMCILVYTVGTDVNFNKLTGEHLKWYADTPTGRVFSNSPGYDPKYGIRLIPYTKEHAVRDAREKALKENEERVRREKEAQDKINKENEDRKRKEAEEINRQKVEKEQQILNQLNATRVTNVLFFEGGKNAPPYGQRIYKSSFDNREIKIVWWELNLQHPDNAHAIDYDIVVLWHFPDGHIEESRNIHTKQPDWTSFNCVGGKGNLMPGDYTVEFFLQGNKIANSSFSVYSPRHSTVQDSYNTYVPTYTPKTTEIYAPTIKQKKAAKDKAREANKIKREAELIDNKPSGP